MPLRGFSGVVLPKAFISYRREDSQDVSGRLYDHLVARWGAERVFKDVDSIPLGMDFREHLTEAVGRCEVMLVVIGPRWVEAAREGRRRLEDPLDFVRIEVEAALQRGVPVVPVLVGGAAVPAPEELPESLRPLAYRQASVLRPDPDFRGDVARIIHGVERLPARAAPVAQSAPPTSAPPPLPKSAAGRPSGPPLSERVFVAAGRVCADAWRALGACGSSIGAWAGGAGRDAGKAARSARASVRRARA
ncbi:MAG: TIR domain-containing protein, partial [Leptolyngbya sp. PLA1]|nr:TIR domain-containing protein [Leptolyngbya sp. PLA1]